jgi:hypothetical protein
MSISRDHRWQSQFLHPKIEALTKTKTSRAVKSREFYSRISNYAVWGTEHLLQCGKNYALSNLPPLSDERAFV